MIQFIRSLFKQTWHIQHTGHYGYRDQYGNGDRWMRWVDVPALEDEIRGLVLLLENSIPIPFEQFRRDCELRDRHECCSPDNPDSSATTEGPCVMSHCPKCVAKDSHASSALQGEG